MCAQPLHVHRASAAEADDQTKADERAEAKEHPALDARRPADAAATGRPFVDPTRAASRPSQDSKFWARPGCASASTTSTSTSTPHGLERAISAYSKVLERPDDRNYNLALYKVAWAYYRASRYPEAIEHFWRLVSGRTRSASAPASGSELRDEAIQYLAIAFAYDDWNENQIPDPHRGACHAASTRVQDPKLMPQDRPWTSEVYFRARLHLLRRGEVPAGDRGLEARAPALADRSAGARGPEQRSRVAHTRAQPAGRGDRGARASWANYSEGTDWWEANKDHPIEQRRAEQLAEDALINTAVCAPPARAAPAPPLRRDAGPRAVHAGAGAVRPRRAWPTAATSSATRTTRRRTSSVQPGRRAVLVGELRRGGHASTRRSATRTSTTSTCRVAARLRGRVAQAPGRKEDRERGELQHAHRAARARGHAAHGGAGRDAASCCSGWPSARELYLARVDEAHDTEKVRDSYYYNNTLLLYLYGYWDLARDALLRRVYETHCAGRIADETGQVAWLNLRNMAVALGQTDEVSGSARELQRAQVHVLARRGTAVATVDCKQAREQGRSRSASPAQDLTNLRYRDAVDDLRRAPRRRTRRRAAPCSTSRPRAMLVKAVNDEPNHPQAPLALEKAAIALERTSRFESAARLYQRIIDEVGPRKGSDAGGAGGARRDPGQRVLPPRVQRQPLLRLRPRGRELPHAGRLAALRAVERARRWPSGARAR